MIIAILIFLALCFLASIAKFNSVGKPYNGLFVLVSGIMLVGSTLLKYENVAVTTPWASLQTKIDAVRTTQKQIVDIVNKTIEIIDFQRKIPTPAIAWGPELDDSVRQYEAKIKLLEDRLRQLASEE